MLTGMATQTLPLGLLTSLLMTLMGPVALMPRFATLTAGETALRRAQIAAVATAASAAVVLLAVMGGADKLAKLGTSQPALILAAGLILTLGSLMNILASKPQRDSADEPKNKSPSPRPLTIGIAPLAIPGVITPVAVCILLIFASYFPTTEDKFKIMQAAFGVLVLDFLAMLVSGWFMRRIGTFPLVLLGAAFGVLQLALGVEMLISGISKAFNLR